MQNKTKTILAELRHCNLTANEIIERKANEMAYNLASKILRLQHLNKMQSPMEKDGLISCVGRGDDNTKLWSITKKGLDELEEMDYE